MYKRKSGCPHTALQMFAQRCIRRLLGRRVHKEWALAHETESCMDYMPRDAHLPRRTCLAPELRILKGDTTPSQLHDHQTVVALELQ